MLISVNSFADENCCQKIETISIEAVAIKPQTLEDLRNYKEELKNSKEKIDYVYYYTLTHNRIYMKSQNINNAKRFQELRTKFANKPESVEKINQLEIALNEKMKLAFDNINVKTQEVREQNKIIIDAEIEAVNQRIKEKSLFPRIGL